MNGCSAQITDRDFKVKFLATDAESFSEERIRAAEKAPLRLDDGKVLHTMPVSGDYTVGQRVEHPKFGVGIVQRIETLATDHKLVVAFDGAGEKTLLAKFAKLTKL